MDPTTFSDFFEDIFISARMEPVSVRKTTSLGAGAPMSPGPSGSLDEADPLSLKQCQLESLNIPGLVPKYTLGVPMSLKILTAQAIESKLHA